MIAPSLIIASELFEGVAPEEVTAENVFSLRSTPLAGYESIPPFEMTSKDGTSRPVRTIAELREAEHEGFFAGTNAALRIWSYFKRVDDLLSALFMARASRVSFLKPISSVEYLPARLLPFRLNVENPGAPTNPPEPNVTVADMASAGRCKVNTKSANQVFIQAEVETTLTEVMRGDLNGDGVEDVLIWQFHRMSGGTMHWSDSLALTRTTDNAMFSKVDLPFR